MIIKHANDVEKEVPTLAGTKGVALQWLISKKDGAENYAMRLFTLEPGGIIPMHRHDDMEHQMFIVEGEAVLKTPEKEISIRTNDVLFVQTGDQHSFINNSDKPFKFICVIPLL